MRLRRWILVGVTVGATFALPVGASADGGAFIDFLGGSGSGTHFLPGDGANGTAFVSIPERRQDLLDRGPFYVYLVPGNAWIREGRPLPDGVIRLGTATIERDSGTVFRVSTSFSVPDVPGELYTVQICNEPCTISGFRESLSGQISIVQTTREAELLNEQQRLWGRNWSLGRHLRRAERDNEELQATIGSLSAERDELAARVTDLEARLAPASIAADTSEAGRPLVEAWALVAIVAALLVSLVSVGLGLVFSRRYRRRLVVPDTIAELDGLGGLEQRSGSPRNGLRGAEPVPEERDELVHG